MISDQAHLNMTIMYCISTSDHENESGINLGVLRRVFMVFVFSCSFILKSIYTPGLNVETCLVQRSSWSDSLSCGYVWDSGARLGVDSNLTHGETVLMGRGNCSSHDARPLMSKMEEKARCRRSDQKNVFIQDDGILQRESDTKKPQRVLRTALVVHKRALRNGQIKEISSFMYAIDATQNSFKMIGSWLLPICIIRQNMEFL